MDKAQITLALESFPRLLDAIPKGKRITCFNDASAVEIALRKSARVLQVIRQYFLDGHGGKPTPFTLMIDELIPQDKPEGDG